MSVPVKLLHLVDSLHAGGMENIVVQVCNGLDPARFEVAVGCLSRSGPFQARLRPGLTCVSLDKPPGFSWRAVMLSAASSNKAAMTWCTRITWVG